jgi:ribosome biogenesis protein BMS1
MVNYSNIKTVHDPCPVGQKGQKRGLKKHEKMLYAPQSNIGMTMFDETGDYVEIPDKHVVFTKKEGQDLEIEEHEGVQMMRNLQKGIEEEEDEDIELVEGMMLEEGQNDLKIEGEDEDDLEIGKLAMKVHQEYREVQVIQNEDSDVIDLNEIVYPNLSKIQEENQKQEFSTNNSFYLNRSEKKVLKEETKNDFIELILENCEDNSYFYPTDLQDVKFYSEYTKCRFVTGFQGNDSDAEDSEDEEMEIDDDSSVDMEDYESDNEAINIEKNKEIEDMKTTNNLLMIKGSYIRIELSNIPQKIFKKFSEMPVIVSQLATGESQMGFLMVKFKRHRFYRNLLKTNDPLIVSLNFNKYQTVPYFCKKDFGQRLRMLKYTPKHEFCLAVFYGNYVPAQTGVVAFQTISICEGNRLIV